MLSNYQMLLVGHQSRCDILSKYELFGGSIPGPLAQKKNKPNQDKFNSTLLHDIGAIIATADGAGSLAKSDYGAQLAIDTLFESALKNSSSNVEELLEESVQTARNTLFTHEDRAQIGCTLATAILTNDSAHISITGDAFAVLWYEDGSLELVENPRK